MAEVYFDGQWVPICGHMFWDNNVGINLFCQEFGFDSGVVKDRNLALQKDGLRVGRCETGDAWLECSRGCGQLEIGGSCNWGSCTKGSDGGIAIKCVVAGM